LYNLWGIVTSTPTDGHDRFCLTDLKPSNLFLPDGDISRVKILDFGIARYLHSSRKVTRSRAFLGTPEYMAPEQARGSRWLTPASDIFSLGCVFYECLSGQPPFVGDHMAAVLLRILSEAPTPIANFRPGVPQPIHLLLGKMLHKDPELRPANASILVRSLQGLEAIDDSADVPPPLTRSVPLNHGSLAEADQQLFSIVLAMLSGLPLAANQADAGGTLPAQPTELPSAQQREGLERMLEALGLQVDFMSNGAMLVSVSQLDSAIDQAAQAARAALVIKECWPAAAVAVTTGCGSLHGRTIVGEVVERAGRMLRKDSWPASPLHNNGVLLDALSAKLLQGRFAQTPQPDGALLLSEEKEVDASRLLLGKPTPCVGRDTELGVLELQLAGCIEESQARAILLTAPPGVGKSRLRHEFLRRVEKRGEVLTILRARGELLRAGAAYGILGQAIRTLCGISGEEPVDDQRQRLRLRIAMHVPAAEQEETFLFLGELCDVSFSEHEYLLLRTARQNAKTLPLRLRRAFLSWLALECRAAPVLFILDDLQWGDESTVALLDEALRELRSAPLFVLALARPEVHTTFPALWREHMPQELVLKGLSQRACERLIRQALGNQISIESVAGMVEQSGGNALFLEELIRAAVEEPLSQKPETVIAMLQARIGHLAVGPRRAVMAASVLGQTLWQAGVAHILRLPIDAPELEGWLRALTQAEFIEPHSSSHIPGEKEFGFRHALVRDAAYGLLTKAGKELGHKLAAEFLGTEDKQIGSALLAYHFRHAGLYGQALACYLDAGDRARKIMLLLEARTHYAAADETIQLLPSTPALRRQRVDILLKRVHTGMTSLAAKSHLSLLDEAQSLLDSLNVPGIAEPEDRLRSAWIDFYYARTYSYANQPGLLIPYLQRGLPIAQAFGDQELLALTSVVLGMATLCQGQIDQARQTLLPLQDSILQTLGSSTDTVRGIAFLGIVFALNGQVRAARGQIACAGAIAKKSEQATLLGLFLLTKAVCHLCTAEWPEAMQAAQETIDCARKTGQTLHIHTALDVLGWAQSYSGLHEQALLTRAQTVAIRKSFGPSALEDWFEAGESEILLNAGNAEEALAKARLVAGACRGSGLLYSAAVAERVIGSALGLLGGNIAEAEEHLAASLDSCERTGQVSNLIHTELWWGRILCKRGNETVAQQHFSRAVKLLTDGGYEQGLLWARGFFSR
jgi:tetratricopeptide (TPR) repeat protein